MVVVCRISTLEVAKYISLNYPNQFYDFPRLANQGNSIVEFFSNTVDTYELSTLNMTTYK